MANCEHIFYTTFQMAVPHGNTWLGQALMAAQSRAPILNSAWVPPYQGGVKKKTLSHWFSAFVTEVKSNQSIRVGFQADGDDPVKAPVCYGHLVTCSLTSWNNGREREREMPSLMIDISAKQASWAAEQKLREIRNVIFQLTQKVIQPLVPL